jgi:hypothetical protein
MFIRVVIYWVAYWSESPVKRRNCLKQNNLIEHCFRFVLEVRIQKMAITFHWSQHLYNNCIFKFWRKKIEMICKYLKKKKELCQLCNVLFCSFWNKIINWACEEVYWYLISSTPKRTDTSFRAAQSFPILKFREGMLWRS